ncbi:MAG: axeA 1 [Gemmataceae bacterium]|nr:axeA 1 [Gemmataceae bacterium]
MRHLARSVAVVIVLAVGLPSARSAEPAKSSTGPWDVAALQKTVVKPEWGAEAGKAREVYYPGELYQGKPTRVFAYYAKPAGAGPFPAVLLVHGGGGKAFRAWAEHWADRGYCALAMDLAGSGPTGRLTDGGPDQTDPTKFRDFTDADARDMWTYHAVSAVLRGHNLLVSFPEVDKDRVGVTGISWGGYLTCIIAGLDDRLKAAVPVYGCGFLDENSIWKSTLDQFSADRRDRWVKAFDPSRYLPGVKCPILFLNGTNDFAYPLDSYKKSYELVKAPRTVSVRVRLPHGHIWNFGEVDTFIDSYLKKGEPLPTIGAMTREGETVSAAVTAKGKLKAGQLYYAVATGAWQKREWKSAPGEITNGQVKAKLPADRPLVYYLAVTDERGLEVSAPHAEMVKEEGEKKDR